MLNPNLLDMTTSSSNNLGINSIKNSIIGQIPNMTQQQFNLILSNDDLIKQEEEEGEGEGEGENDETDENGDHGPSSSLSSTSSLSTTSNQDAVKYPVSYAELNNARNYYPSIGYDQQPIGSHYPMNDVHNFYQLSQSNQQHLMPGSSIQPYHSNQLITHSLTQCQQSQP